MKRGIKIIALLIELFFVLVFLMSSIYYKLVSYGIDQGTGQLSIVWNARPVKEVLNDLGVDDSVKVKLRLIEQIKKFAIDSLGLKASKNYTTLYDQHGKPVLWVLTASEKYQLKSFEWKFPVVGQVSYKGFFNYKKGKKEEQKLKDDGLDTDFQPTSAWSTLGWFRDPILSNFLFRNEGQIAELIIHEMTHATLYVKSSVDFNENLASAVGEEGAERFLKSTYGDSSVQLLEYRNRNDDYNRFASHMLYGAKRLDSLYHSFGTNDKNNMKEMMKQQVIMEVVSSLDTVSFHNKKRFTKIFDENYQPNNAYFLGFMRYDAQKEEMKKELREKFGQDIKKYLYDLKNKSD